jgi:cytochrome P450
MPPKDPIIGALSGHILGLTKRLDYFLDCHRTYGDYVHLKIASLNVLMVSEPEGVSYVLKKNSRNYTKNTPAYKVVESVTGKGVFTESEGSWLKLRKVSQPFFSNHQTENWQRIVESVCKDFESKLNEVYESKTEQNFSPMMTQYALRVLGETIFDKDLGEYVEVFDKELGRLIEITNKMITQKLSLNIPSKIKQKRDFKKSVANLEALITTFIDEAKEKESNPKRNMIHAFLEAPIEIDHQFLLDQVKTMIFAGHETTSTVLSWALHFLSIHPEWQEKLYKELKEVYKDEPLNAKDLDKLELLEMFTNEVMRLYPPAWSFARRALDDDDILGHEIKKGDVVSISPYLLHHDTRYWDEPFKFNPMRFTKEETSKRPTVSFIPFGLGPRACIGEKLSRMEMKMLLITTINNYKLNPSKNVKVEMEQVLTLRPKNGVYLNLEKRV